MTTNGSGEIIYELRRKIQQIQSDLNQLGEPVSDLPELIVSANLLRSNEYLSKTNEKKTELLSYYLQYSNALEELLSSVFDIQHDLKEILKEQSVLISPPTKKQSNGISKTKSKTKSKTNSKITHK